MVLTQKTKVNIIQDPPFSAKRTLVRSVAYGPKRQSTCNYGTAAYERSERSRERRLPEARNGEMRFGAGRPVAFEFKRLVSLFLDPVARAVMEARLRDELGDARFNLGVDANGADWLQNA